jgi:hypothetical protein
MTRPTYYVLFMLAIVAAGSASGAAAAAGPEESLEGCVVSTSPQAMAPVAKAAEMLRDEMAKRTGQYFKLQSALPAGGIPAIVLGTADDMPTGMPKPPSDIAVPVESEGYAIWVDTASRKAPTVCVVGRDARGALFGAGRLLRALRMKKEELSLDADFRISTAPCYPVRGHELGYRDTANAYDAWSVEQYEQYIRDLAVFGANTVQLLAPLNHMQQEGRHMTEPIAERLVKLTRLIGSYGLRTWIWMPPGEDAFNADTREDLLATCRSMFQQWSPISAILVPGGDPGDAHPKDLLPWVRDMAAVLRESHPDAEVWISNEDIPQEGNAYLFDYLKRERPPWLTGIAFGTWVKLPLHELREQIPKQYPIVQYCDITHSIECQYPVRDWDSAFALTLGREPINPRPLAMTQICKRMTPFSVGFNTYSDGVNDDVNKVIWTAMGWDPGSDAKSVLSEYGRYFVGEDLGDGVAEGLLALERNWEGPLLTNRRVKKTLAHWQSLEKAADGDALDSWRFQMGLFRAYYDAYVQARLVAETKLEERAMRALGRAKDIGPEQAVAEARKALAELDGDPPAFALRQRVEKLGEMLFNSIGMQLSVERYGARNWERGAVLDALDQPLNNRLWLEGQLDAIMATPDNGDRLVLIATIVDWEDPGLGGFYDDFGNPSKQPHLVRQMAWDEDPGSVESPQNEFIEIKGREAWRHSWLDQGQTLYGTPLLARYEGLDPKTPYRLRVVYTGRFRPTMRLVADGQHEIHGPLAQPNPVAPVEFEIPAEATADGVLDLEWQLISGRGCQVGEAWLLPADKK